MRNWIFQCNLTDFDIDGYLALGPHEITWLVRRYASDIQPGDVVYMWRSAGGQKNKAGIVARATVLTAPSNILDDPAAAPFWKHDAPTGTSTRVKLRVDGIANSREFIKREWLVDGDFQERCRRLAPIQVACRKSNSSLAGVTSGGSLIQTTDG